MNNKKREKTKKAAKIMAIILAVAMLVVPLSYLFMMVGGYFGDSGLYVYAIDDFDQATQIRLDNLEEIIRFIKENYKDEITENQLVRGLYNGLMDSLGDKWSSYYFADDSTPQQMTESLSNDYYGVGITMQLEAGKILIIDVNKKGPACEAGVKMGTYLVAVDGSSIAGLSANEVALKVRGPEGSKVTITTEDIDGVRKNFTVVRRKIIEASVFYEIKESNIGYIEISSMSANTAAEFKEAKENAIKDGAKSLVIDLRDNGGGYVDQAVQVADLLMDDGVIAYYMQQGKEYDVIKATKDDGKKLPLVVLINENTASAAELLAGALKDSAGAKLVGETSYGKGVAQATVNVTNGDSIKLSIFYFLTPKKKDINQVGITPDYIVYANGLLSDTEASEMISSMVPLTYNRCYKGEYDINVLAAQQRLKVLGYAVDTTGILDEKTSSAFSSIQKAAGLYTYGNLDRNTCKAIEEKFNQFLSINEKDEQLEKAISLCK